MNNEIKELLELIRTNPDLPVVPMVDAEIIGDDCGYWLGAWGRACVDEYLVAKRAECIVYRSNDDVFNALYLYLSNDEYERLPDTESECRPIYDALPWIKAIIVYIGLPEEADREQK